MVGKRSLNIISLAAVTVLTLGWSGWAVGGTPGDAGMLSLRLGVGAREAAMGETGAASSRGASALYWNPANNVFADFETELVLQHHRYLGLFNQQAAAVAHKAGAGVIGFMFSGLYSDEIERRGEEPVGVAEGTFRPYDLSLAASYARGFGDSFSASVTGKFLYQRIDIYSDTGIAFDFFLTHKAVVEGLMFALGVTNVGGEMNLKDEPFKLPTTFRGGVAWTPASDGWSKLTVTGDFVAPNDTNEKAHLGAEFRLVPEFALRLGTRVNYENQGLTAGAGFRAGLLGVDYAYGESKVDGFDDGHKFSLNLVW